MDIMFDDLNYEAQQQLLKEAGVSTPEEMDWDEVPVAVVEFDKDKDDSDDDFMGEEFLDDSFGYDDDEEDLLE